MCQKCVKILKMSVTVIIQTPSLLYFECIVKVYITFTIWTLPLESWFAFTTVVTESIHTLCGLWGTVIQGIIRALIDVFSGSKKRIIIISF